jgi:hypothetical protein
MLLLRAAFLELLLCLHVIGAAVLFRRLFPRESPWLGFLVPVMALLAALNFIEHFIALPNLGWLLPVTVAGSLWAILKPGYSWEGLRFPAILFVVTFTALFGLKCQSPDISNFSEGLSNLARILNYTLGGTLPPIDSLMSPYDYGGYYTFQHYGAAILKRLFLLDLGTAYNLAFAFLMTWICLMGAGAAYAISGKKWIAVAAMLVLLSSCPGSMPYLIFFGHHGADYGQSLSLNSNWDNPDLNPFASICAQDKTHPILNLVPPVYCLYWSEFHATVGGAFMAIASVLACVEVFRPGRSNWPWICLIVLPMAVIITSALFFFEVAFFCIGSFALALLVGRRPEDWKFVGSASAAGLLFLWPSVYSLLGNSSTPDFSWTDPADYTPCWMFAIQWWPVYLPWLLLCFVWHRLDAVGRWFHTAIPLLLIWVEVATFGDRGLTTEKMWGGIYGAGTVTLLPLLLMQRNFACRLVGALPILGGLLCLVVLVKFSYFDSYDLHSFAHLQGDSLFLRDPQRIRLMQVMKSLHGATVLPGKSYWSFNEAPALVIFSENRSYISYTNQEIHAGHADETFHRDKMNNDFYNGKVADPLPFLRSNNIAAVLIWPEDKISDLLLQRFQTQIGPDYFYIDCKMDGTDNAGVFMRQTPSPPVSRVLYR